MFNFAYFASMCIHWEPEAGSFLTKTQQEYQVEIVSIRAEDAVNIGGQKWEQTKNLDFLWRASRFMIGW